MSKIKLVATDIDGTILKHNGEFTKEVIDCIKTLSAKDIKVVLVTGRMHKSAKKIADELGLCTPIVSYQGALVRDNTAQENIIYERYIPDDKAKSIINWCKNANVHINLYLNDNLYVEKENEFTKKYAGHQHIPFNVISFDKIEIKKVNKILLIDYNDADKITYLSKKLQEDYPELFIVKSTDYFCEVCHKEATKGDGVKCLEQFYGITKDVVLTIGDHNNDIELIKAGGIGVAMGNATDELKSVADFVTDTVENNGFVKAMEKFVL